MAPYPRIQEQHIAVFGETGSGKTVLLSSFFGPSQERAYANDLWDLVADDTGQGNRLYQNYVGMRDRAVAPAATRFSSTTYTFSVKLKSGDVAPRKRPFDVLRLVWHDYPGEWFQESPSSAAEAADRVTTFRSLLRSDVALLLVDGQRLLDHQGEEERYLKSLITNFRQALLRLKDDVTADGERLVEFPRIWMIALSKADLFPDWDVYAFRDLVLGGAADHLDDLRATLQDLIETPDALSVGEDFMLLSSAKFELSSSTPEPPRIDVTRQVGLDLILPVAAILPLQRRVAWNSRMEIPRRVLDTVAHGAELLAATLGDKGHLRIDKVLNRLPGVGPVAAKLAAPLIVSTVNVGAQQLRQANARARADHDFLTATVTQLSLDLMRGIDDHLLLKSRK
ncbi:MAG: ATP/GTP-binding protein [Actinomycetota bacterium]|nr:ATP/GTP-binding protein [Actinomycetota bacterium]